MIKREDLIVGAEFLNSIKHKLKVVYSNNIDTAFEHDTGDLTVYRTDYVLSNFDYPKPEIKVKKIEVADYFYYGEICTRALNSFSNLASGYKKVVGSERTISIEVNENDC